MNSGSRILIIKKSKICYFQLNKVTHRDSSRLGDEIYATREEMTEMDSYESNWGSSAHSGVMNSNSIELVGKTHDVIFGTTRSLIVAVLESDNLMCGRGLEDGFAVFRVEDVGKNRMNAYTDRSPMG